jgi:tight adherence protein B
VNQITGTTLLLKYLGILLLPVGVAILVWVFATDVDSLPRRLFRKHVNRLQRRFDEMFIATPAQDIAQLQIAALLIIPTLAVLLSQPMYLFVLIGATAGPEFWIVQERTKRITQMEEQLAQWLMLLANALRATPSVGASVEASVKLVPQPLRDHIDLVVKEMRLGVPVERALLNMGRRIDSQTLQSALATVVISQRTGGDVPRLLEESAGGLREMARLEALIRAKTAEGKSQAIVLAVVPLALSLLINQIKPGWFDALFDNVYGYAIIIGVAVLWTAATYMANRILDVEV